MNKTTNVMGDLYTDIRTKRQRKYAIVYMYMCVMLYCLLYGGIYAISGIMEQRSVDKIKGDDKAGLVREVLFTKSRKNKMKKKKKVKEI